MADGDVKYNEKHIQGKMKALFGVPNKVMSRIKYDLSMLYHFSTPEYYIRIEDIHKLIIKFFYADYYPLISRNINIDDTTMAIIMGGVAFNMNIPKQTPYYKMATDDVDLKIYTTAINYLEHNERAMTKILSVYRFTNLIICMYLKQILNFINYFSESIPDIELPSLKRGIPDIKEYTRKRTQKLDPLDEIQDMQDDIPGDMPDNANIHMSIPDPVERKQRTQKQTIQKQGIQKQGIQTGGSVKVNRGLDVSRFENGQLIDYKITVQIKKKDEHNINVVIQEFEIDNIGYNDIYNLILANITDINTTITTKIEYNMKYHPDIKTRARRRITFSDCTIIYPSLGNPGFFSHYFYRHPLEMEKSIATLVKKKIIIDGEIQGLKKCGNNCRFLNIEALMLDTVLMISFANYLEYEKLDDPVNKKILVPVAYLWKYWKYLIKFMRLVAIYKYNSGTLNGIYQKQMGKLENYIKFNLRKLNTNQFNEEDPINLHFKRVLNNFHQGLFINQTLLDNEYSELREMVDMYLKLVISIESSRALFKKLDDDSVSKGQTVNSLTIQYASVQKSKLTDSLEHSKQSRHSKHSGQSRKASIRRTKQIKDKIARKKTKKNKKHRRRRNRHRV